MPKWLPKSCKRCHVKAADGHVISRRGLCRPCAARAMQLALGIGAAVRSDDPEAVERAIEAFRAGAPPMRVGDTSGRQTGSETPSTVDSDTPTK